jgi:predicted metal-dependent phosphoesterase TrpH
VGRKFEFSVDMHVHSMYSGESLARPRDIIDAALEKGLDAIVITNTRASMPALRSRSSAVRPRDHPPRVELTTDCGHMLVYGTQRQGLERLGQRPHGACQPHRQGKRPRRDCGSGPLLRHLRLKRVAYWWSRSSP